MKVTWGSETSQYPEEQKTQIRGLVTIRLYKAFVANGCYTTDSRSSGERTGISLNFFRFKLLVVIVFTDGCR